MVDVLNNSNFDNYLKDSSDKTIIVYFWASWCDPCKQFSETFSKLSNDDSYDKVCFASIDVEKESNLLKDFNIRSVPTVIIFRNHIALSVESGVLAESEIKSLLDDAMALDMQKVQEDIARKIVE